MNTSTVELHVLYKASYGNAKIVGCKVNTPSKMVMDVSKAPGGLTNLTSLRSETRRLSLM